MRRTATILLMLFMASTRVGAQDTAALGFRSESDKMWIAQPAVVTSAALMTAGSVMTFVPELHDLCVDLRDAVQADGHGRLTFDNYVQYLPMSVPFALKICGLRGRSSFRDMVNLTALSYGGGAVILNSVKYLSHIQRPDFTSFTSFPSGHTFTAFTGAELIRREYGEEYPLIAVAGYAVATLTGLMRIYNNRHWASDVLAGAGLGIMSVNVGYWLGDKVLEWHQRRNRTALAPACEVSNGYLLSF